MRSLIATDGWRRPDPLEGVRALEEWLGDL
jgi:hypothetical protein